LKEFKELGMSIEKMTDKIYKDFIRQKEFNENTSHELQTPVAIIRNKLELLIQSKNLREEDMEIIESVFDAVKRLSLLNKGLLLISKIENRQFTEIQKVNIINLIEECIQNYQFQIQEKNIVLDNQFTTDFAIESNPILMEILINNLLSNAIKHNFDKGYIHIKITNGFLVIENSGKKLNVETDTIFERFKKDSDSEQSIGLGLAIVKKICLLLDYKIKYYNKEEVHRMEVKLS
jgi:signal transduction histidine kinase